MPMTFAREAWPFVLPFVLLAAGLYVYDRYVWGTVAVVAAFLVLLFFRDPVRRYDGPPGVVLAAADGVVLRVDVVEDQDVGPGRFQRIVTFLSVFDVHIQRTPVAGRVVASTLRRGRKVAAFRGDAGEVNEQHTTVLERADGDRIGVRQIAGLVARRVVAHLEVGQSVERGERLGLIKFGSRVDVLVPEGYEILVEKGDRLKTAATAIARRSAIPTGGEVEVEPSAEPPAP